MSITELLNKIGAENIQFQTLSDSFKSAFSGKKDGTVSFYTSKENVHALGGMGAKTPVCLILWIDKDKFNEATK